MRVLVLGRGGREHALAWKFSRSNRITGLFCAPGNPGTATLGTNLDLSEDDVSGIVEAVRKYSIDLVFVGPEAPLAEGVVDHLNRHKIAVIGPHREAARLEGSKLFAKEFMNTHGIPTATASIVTNQSELDSFLAENPGPIVVKMDGLASGKGVAEFNGSASSRAFAIDALKKGPVLLEERLSGYEISVFVVTDGRGYRILPPSADYKKAGEKGSGPNTGGMGAIAPVPWLDEETWTSVVNNVVTPTVEGLASSGLMYTGLLYIGVMVTDRGPRVLEYNVRFGDPETQVVLPLLRADLLDICDAMLNGTIDRLRLETDDVYSIGIVVASPGYPGSYPSGQEVTFTDPSANSLSPRDIDRLVFHSGTTIGDDGNLVTAGGRCFTCVYRDSDIVRARAGAYELAQTIHFQGAWFRGDIASRVFGS
ncbi:MAG: phosphoribosylamine--glycine ligase [Spirochaetales bacterium]